MVHPCWPPTRSVTGLPQVTMDSGDDEESELDTKRNKMAGNQGEKAKPGRSVW